MAIRTHFDSLTGMEQVLAMGVEEGMCIVFSQIDDVLAGTARARARLRSVPLVDVTYEHTLPGRTADATTGRSTVIQIVAPRSGRG